LKVIIVANYLPAVFLEGLAEHPSISWRSMIKRMDYILRASIFGIYFGIFFLAFWAPFIQHIKGYPSGESVYSLFSTVCHQYPTRCFWIFERPWALCARCSSSYLGIALAAVLIKLKLSFLKRALFGLLLVAIAAIDPILQSFGFYESNNFFRLLTGIVGGLGIFMLIYPIPLTIKEI
jgi:uncharacterized membrane protein